MNEKDITVLIGKAIREGKYLSISYLNQKGDETHFWIRILDIDANGKLTVDMYNVAKGEQLDTKIFISHIQKAEILKFSHCEVSDELVKKLEEDESLSKFSFERYDRNLLNYYLECYKANQDPFLYKAHLIPKIDNEVLLSQKSYLLSDEQQLQIIKEIYHNDYPSYYDYELAICELSIDLPQNKKFVVAFRKLTFDPIKKTLETGSKVQFNPGFYIDKIKYSLSYYTDMSPADFETSYLSNKDETIGWLKKGFDKGEMINTRPELIVLGYSQINISGIYDDIQSELAKPEKPIKAFFENTSLLDRKNKTEPNIVLFDSNINLDQLRTVYNALKYPITYVQGPPGTGKTQTLLNIAVNCMLNERTLLITSNNNTPIDGIKDKLNLGKYRDKDILFPVIRLGSNKRTIEALRLIKELNDFKTSDKPKETLLFNIRKQAKEKNSKLVESLKAIEDRIEQEQKLKFVNRLLENKTNSFLEEEKRNIEEQLALLPEINKITIEGVFEVVENNDRLLQYFYFESIKRIRRLQHKNLSELHKILSIQEEKEQVKEFNRWIANDTNLEKFTKVFPILLSTNISCRKLGRHYKFDIMAMDEAAQCDIATGLIPISKCISMVLIGDTNQLKPIIVIDKSRNDQLMQQFQVDKHQSYLDNSILSYFIGIDGVSNNILLSHHYRCGENIIRYSNMRFYSNKLNLSGVTGIGELQLLLVKNTNPYKKNGYFEEAQIIIDFVKNNRLKDVFIITPFRNQEEIINKLLAEAKVKGEIDDTVECGTVHKIQGQENKTIVFSTALSQSTHSTTYNWIKNNSQLLNVAVTRAKEKLIVVTDEDAIDTLSRKDDDLYALIQYMRSKGNTQVAESEVNKYTIGFSNNSKFEDEFYKTMQHYCSIYNGRFARNVKVTSIFPEEYNNPLVNQKEFDGVLYTGNTPEIIFEVNGAEHYNNKRSIKSDSIKRDLLIKKKIRSIHVPNLYVKHFEYIGEMIRKLRSEPVQIEFF